MSPDQTLTGLWTLSGTRILMQWFAVPDVVIRVPDVVVRVPDAVVRVPDVVVRVPTKHHFALPLISPGNFRTPNSKHSLNSFKKRCWRIFKMRVQNE